MDDTLDKLIDFRVKALYLARECGLSLFTFPLVPDDDFTIKVSSFGAVFLVCDSVNDD